MRQCTSDGTLLAREEGEEEGEEEEGEEEEGEEEEVEYDSSGDEVPLPHKRQKN